MGVSPIGFYPDVETFIGEGGTLGWPEAIIKDDQNFVPVGTSVKGFEALGGIRFRLIQLMPKEEVTYILLMFIGAEDFNSERLITKYGSLRKFEEALKQNNEHWLEKNFNPAFRYQ